MPRASSPCSQPGCPELQPCPTHRVRAWSNSTRNEHRVLSGWAEQKRNKQILKASDVCYVCGQPGADQVDHVVNLAAGGTDTPDNLAPIHAAPCHSQKTREESKRAQQ